MTRFDELLRRGLMDANLVQYERILQQADSAEPDFSPRYLRERTRMLADPWGWVRRRRRGKRLDWRLIAIVAALLILSACAYAVVTGQFAQWFPRLKSDPAGLEVSEEIMSRTGTVIEQSQTVDGATVTLNAAVRDEESVRLSIVAEVPELPEELTADSRLYTEECSLEMPEEQWKEYVRNEKEAVNTRYGRSKDYLEDYIQAELDLVQAKYWSLGFNLLSLTREDNTLTFEVWANLGAYLEHPDLTLHMENIAIYDSDDPVSWHDDVRTGPGPGVSVLKGPFDFSFTLEEPVMPISYVGDVQLTYEDIPLRFTRLEISVFDIDTDYEVLAPVAPVLDSSSDTGEAEPEPDPDMLDNRSVHDAIMAVVQGLWRSDGTYVDLSGCFASSYLSTSQGGQGAYGSTGRLYPHVIDPASVTAVDLGGTRVELGNLEVLEE